MIIPTTWVLGTRTSVEPLAALLAVRVSTDLLGSLLRVREEIQLLATLTEFERHGRRQMCAIERDPP